MVNIPVTILLKDISSKRGNTMSGLEEKLGPGHQQIILGLLIFAAGALWGIMLANGEDTDMKDLFISAVIMLSGAMITLLGVSFGTDSEEDRTNDLQDAINDLTGMLNNLQSKMMGGDDEGGDEGGDDEAEE
jgi:hypothetical protein